MNNQYVGISWKGKLKIYLDLIRWNRPAGWLLLLWPTLSALWLAAEGFPGWHLLIVFIMGTILMRSAGCAFNDVADRNFDLHVKRTAQRPVASGAIGVRQALFFGFLLALIAFALVLTLNMAGIVWSFAALAIALIYPYAKRFVSMPQAVLGVAFSFGIPMAYVAVQADGVEAIQAWQAVPLKAWQLLISNLFWVLAYDTEYAMVDRDDDIRIGMKTSAITLARYDVTAIIVFYILHLSIWFYLLLPVNLAWPFAVSLLLACAQVVWHFQLIKNRTRAGCFEAFRLNHWLGATLFLGVALGYALR
jgi:4-hydroxybenzoate polyprenyltransferase